MMIVMIEKTALTNLKTPLAPIRVRSPALAAGSRQQAAGSRQQAAGSPTHLNNRVNYLIVNISLTLEKCRVCPYGRIPAFYIFTGKNPAIRTASFKDGRRCLIRF